MSSVTFKAVSKSYGDVVALDSLDLEVRDGEFISLLGPSGSGKSTTLNLLAGLQDVSAGRVFIGDRDVTDLPPEKRDLALVFQNYALYPHMTLFENIAFPLQARSPVPSTAEIDKKVRATAEALGVGDLLARYPKEISGGQQQRVALGRAMVRDPRVFLLDEPLSNLDARLRIRMRRDLKALHAQLQSTIVYVTHDQSEAMTLSDRIAIFNDGRLQQLGTPEDVYYRPANTFIANFVGERESNFYEAELIEEDGRVKIVGDGPNLTLERAMPADLAQRRVLIGVRPESVELTSPKAKAAMAIAEVADFELVGADLYVFVQTPSGLEICSRRDPKQRVSRGETVGLTIKPGDVHIFDAESRACISPGDASAPTENR